MGKKAGIPWVSKISTSGYREYSSITTKSISPDGRGPQKSTERFCHGPGGKSVMCNGSRGCWITFA
jgi:hypothetical protein